MFSVRADPAWACEIAITGVAKASAADDIVVDFIVSSSNCHINIFGYRPKGYIVASLTKRTIANELNSNRRVLPAPIQASHWDQPRI